jgi:hypothetical protein
MRRESILGPHPSDQLGWDGMGWDGIGLQLYQAGRLEDRMVIMGWDGMGLQLYQAGRLEDLERIG